MGTSALPGHLTQTIIYVYLFISILGENVVFLLLQQCCVEVYVVERPSQAASTIARACVRTRLLRWRVLVEKFTRA